MLKKMISWIVAIGLMPVCRVYAQNPYEIYINAWTSAEVTTPCVTYIPGENLGVEFSVINTTREKLELNVCLEIEADSGKRLGKAEFSRNFKAGEKVPVSYGLSKTNIAENIDVIITVYEKKIGNTIYVSETGDDSNMGTVSEPLKSLSKALEKVSEMNQQEEYEGEKVSVVIKGGNYSVPKTISISEDTVSNFSTFSIESSDDAVLYGGISITGSDFEKVSNEAELAMFPESVSGKLYKINLADFGITTKYDDGSSAANEPIYTILYNNGETEQFAKYPNEGYAEGITTVYPKKEGSVTSAEAKEWKNFDEAWVRGWFIWEWDLVKGRLESISEQDSNGARTLMLEQLFVGSVPADADLPQMYNDKKWYVYNLPEELDIEGEYAIKDNILYYYPEEESVSEGEFEKAKILVNTDSTDMFRITADNVTVKGLTFENSGGYFITASADNFKLLDCEFRNGSKNAVEVKGYNNLVSTCDFHDLGGQGLNLGGGDRATLKKSNSVVENCYFEKTSQVTRTNCSALSLSGCGATARRNTVTNVPHLAMSYAGNDHLIEYNEFYNCLTDNAGDAGIIYTGATLANQGTVIKNNYLHDSNSGLGGIYWDDWLSGQRAEGNVFENLDRVLLVHGGVCNAFNNNIAINASYGAQIRGKARMVAKTVTYTNASGQTVTENIKFNMWDTSPLLKENLGTPYGYNPYMNVFLCTLVGNYHVTNETYPDLPWQGEIWQNAYGNVLKYVNNKTDDLANETELSGNYFVNSQNGIYCYAQMQGKEDTLVINKENIVNATALTGESLEHYNDVVENSGIYSNGLRIVG